MTLGLMDFDMYLLKDKLLSHAMIALLTLKQIEKIEKVMIIKRSNSNAIHDVVLSCETTNEF